MDKQKKIEKLTHEICEILFIKSAQPSCSDCYFRDDCGYKELAEKLLEKYQPKIPENAVVLTREEKQKLLHGMYEQGKFDGVVKFAEWLKTECFDGGIDDKWVAVSFSRLDEICKEITEGK